MNPLEQFILDEQLDPVKAMNTLQNCGVISDNCVCPADVADSDCAAAVKFITGLKRLKITQPQ